MSVNYPEENANRLLDEQIAENRKLTAERDALRERLTTLLRLREAAERYFAGDDDSYYEMREILGALDAQEEGE